MRNPDAINPRANTPQETPDEALERLRKNKPSPDDRQRYEAWLNAVKREEARKK